MKEVREMKTVCIELKGVTPLLINRFKENDEVVEAVKKNGKKDYGTPREQAEATPYFDSETKLLWLPTSWITGAIATVASDYKLPGSRKSVKSVSGGAIVPVEEKMHFVEKYKLKDIEVDSRPVVVQRARIMRHRARLEKWTATTDIVIDETILPVDEVHRILVDAGRRAGFGDYRASKGGPFGKFHVTSWKVRKD
jgi:hypothetical protein